MRTLAAVAYCDGCTEAVLRPLMAARGIATAPRPDWGDGWSDVACRTCEATWVGLDGDACAWCAVRVDQTIDGQRETVTQPPTSDSVEAFKAWRGRLDRAIEAGIINGTQARNAWEGARRRQEAA